MLANLLPTLNQVVSDWRTILVVSAVLCLWSLLSGLFLARAGRTIR